jgi:hypothetical protein
MRRDSFIYFSHPTQFNLILARTSLYEQRRHGAQVLISFCELNHLT